MKRRINDPQDPPDLPEPLPPPPPPPPPAGLTLVGTNGDDLLIGSSFADTIYGLDGDDLLHGGAGNDFIYGGMDDDVLVGGAGADRLDGGAGIDIVSYAYSPSTWGVSVDLALNKGLNGDAQGDTYYGIEDVMGSQYHDLLAGNADANSLWGDTRQRHDPGPRRPGLSLRRRRRRLARWRRRRRLDGRWRRRGLDHLCRFSGGRHGQHGPQHHHQRQQGR